MSCGPTFINISESSTRTIAQGIYSWDRANDGVLVPPTVANAAARTALTPTTTNEIVFQADTNELYRWDGAAWQLVGGFSIASDLNMGGFNIVNVGTVDGVDVSAHASRHLPSGADALATGLPVTLGLAAAIGTANSFARADHVHPWFFGQHFAFDRNTTVTNTTATTPTFTQAHKFTYNAVSAGDYAVFGFYRSSKNTTTTDFIIRVQEDDTNDIHADNGRTLQQEYKDSGGGDGGTGSGTNQRHNNMFFDIRTLTAGNHDFDIDVSRSGGGGGAIATVYDSLMMAFRVS